MFKMVLAGLLLAALPTPGFAQSTGYQNNQPPANLANPQGQTSDSQQPPQARRATGGQAVGQQMTQPSANQNQPQVQTNDNQQPPQAQKSR